jgi:sugar lactone lactonase YvrE
MKKYTLSAICLLAFGAFAFAQKPQLVKKWETDTTLRVPESVLYDAGNKILYASNIDGAPDQKDGKGSIARIGLDGKILSVDWVKGLNAPKGLGLYNNVLWVADVDELVSIDVVSGQITSHVPIAGAAFLNDVTIDQNGVIYVSDTKTKKVHRVENGNVSVYLQDLKGPNGVLIHSDTLYVLDQGTLYKVGANKALVKVADGMDPSTDGVEHIQDNDFIVSAWAGVIYYLHGDGSKDVLLDTRDQKINSADIGYDPEGRIVYVPTFFKNKVVAYDLK